MKIELPIGTKVLIDGEPYIVSERPSELDKKGCRMCLDNLPHRPFISANISIWVYCYSCKKIDNDPALQCVDDRQMFSIKGYYTYFEKAKE